MTTPRQRGVYLVTKSGKYCIAFNRRMAKRNARYHKAQVYRVPVWHYNQCSSWDVPTFCSVGDLIADYTTRNDGSAEGK